MAWRFVYPCNGVVQSCCAAGDWGGEADGAEGPHDFLVGEFHHKASKDGPYFPNLRGLCFL